MRIDIDSGLMVNVKRVDETVTYTFDYFNLIDNDEVILNVSSVTQNNRGLIQGSTDLIVGNTNHDNNNLAFVQLSGGTHGEAYCVNVNVTTDKGDTRQCSGVIIVNNPCE